jgi:hypothetical protein
MIFKFNYIFCNSINITIATICTGKFSIAEIQELPKSSGSNKDPTSIYSDSVSTHNIRRVKTSMYSQLMSYVTRDVLASVHHVE